MYAVAANLSVFFFSSTLLLYRQFILQSSNTLRLVTAQELKQFGIKLGLALQCGAHNRSAPPAAVPCHTESAHIQSNARSFTQMVSISDNIVSIKSPGKHDGYIQIHSFRFYWKGKLQSISWLTECATDAHNPNCNQCEYLGVSAHIIPPKASCSCETFQKKKLVNYYSRKQFFWCDFHRGLVSYFYLKARWARITSAPA